MACVFCRIANAEVAAHRVFEDELVVAFLDRGPIRPGHIQIIPRTHYVVFDDLPTEVANRMIAVGQELAKALKTLSGVERVAFLFTGADVAHAHAHLVPMHEKTDITSRRYIVEEQLTFKATPTASNRALTEMADRIRAARKGTV